MSTYQAPANSRAGSNKSAGPFYFVYWSLAGSQRWYLQAITNSLMAAHDCCRVLGDVEDAEDYVIVRCEHCPLDATLRFGNPLPAWKIEQGGKVVRS